MRDPRLRDRWPDVPWKQMAGLRDILIHAYRDVDEDVVWRVGVREIPALIPQIEEILRSLGVDPDSVP